MNVAFEETPAAAVESRYGFLNHIIQSTKRSAIRNVSSVGRLLQSAKKAASRNVSAILRSAETDPSCPFQVRYQPLDPKKNRKAKVYIEIPIPRPSQEILVGTDETKRKKKEANHERTIWGRSARLHAYAERLCRDNVNEQGNRLPSQI
jgi:hypothetical protein